MTIRRAFQLRATAAADGELGPIGVELILEGAVFTQRLQSRDGTWTEQRSRFDTAIEGREALDRMCSIYARRGTLVTASGETTAPARVMTVVAGPSEAAAVLDDWLQEQGPVLLGETLFELFFQGALPLEVDGKTIVGATVSSVATPSPRNPLRARAHDAHRTLEELLRRPIAHRLRKLTLLERERGDSEPGVVFIPGALREAIGLAANAPAAATLEHLDCAAFERPAPGRLDLRTFLNKLPALTSLRVVFVDGVRISGEAAARLTRLELGWLSSPAQVRDLTAQAWPRLRHLAVGCKPGVRFSQPMREQLLDRSRLPSLTSLSFDWEPFEVWGQYEALSSHGTIEGQDERLFDALLRGGLLPRLQVLRWGPTLHTAQVLANASAFAHLETLELRLTDNVEADAVKQVLPRARVS
jgi:hypothetical protein